MTKHSKIRAVCLRPFADEWEQPTPDEVREVLRLANLSGSEAARYVGITEGRTIRRWTGGDSAIPYACWALLCHAAGLGLIWFAEQDSDTQ